MNRKTKTAYIAIFTLFSLTFLINLFIRRTFSTNTFDTLFVLIYSSLALLSIFHKVRGEGKEKYSGFISFVKSLLHTTILLLLPYIVIYILVGNLFSEVVSTYEYNSISIKFFLYTVIWFPFIEEMIFRFTLRKIISHNISYIIISSLLFTLLHILNTTNPSAFVGYFYGGIIFSTLYLKYENIYVNIIAHSMYNLFILIILKWILSY